MDRHSATPHIGFRAQFIISPWHRMTNGLCSAPGTTVWTAYMSPPDIGIIISEIVIELKLFHSDIDNDSGLGHNSRLRDIAIVIVFLVQDIVHFDIETVTSAARRGFAVA